MAATDGRGIGSWAHGRKAAQDPRNRHASADVAWAWERARFVLYGVREAPQAFREGFEAGLNQQACEAKKRAAAQAEEAR